MGKNISNVIEILLSILFDFYPLLLGALCKRIPVFSFRETIDVKPLGNDERIICRLKKNSRCGCEWKYSFKGETSPL
jgi:hypothetical protein